MKLFKTLAFTLVALIAFTSCDRNDPPISIDDEGTNTGIDSTSVPEEPQDNIYQFTVKAGNGEDVSLSQYRGKVLLVVNTATQCGYTPQYNDLQRIYDNYRERGFEILDFPCNQFGGQAPGSYDDIHDFCTDHYNITFPQFAKINVNGASASPLYVWLKSKKPGNIQWNFTKFLINRNGEVVSRFEPAYSMTKVEEAIEEQL